MWNLTNASATDHSTLTLLGAKGVAYFHPIVDRQEGGGGAVS
jgi:hypothetical protein